MRAFFSLFVGISIGSLATIACSSSDGSTASDSNDRDASSDATGASSSSGQNDGRAPDASTDGMGDHCVDGFCITAQTSAVRVAQVGSEVFVVSTKPTLHLSRVEPSGALTPVGPALAAEGVYSISGDPSQPVVFTYSGGVGANRHIYVLQGSAWTEIPNSDPDAPGNALRLASVLSVGGELYACTGDRSRPVYHYDGAKFVRTEAGVGAAGLLGRSASDVWAFSDTQATRWNGSAWTPPLQVMADCSFGVAAGPSDQTCVGDGSSDAPYHYDGVTWTEAAISMGGWVQGLATHAGKTWAITANATRPAISVLDPSTNAWTTKPIDPLPTEPLRILPSPGAAVLSDGRIVFAAYRADASRVYQDYLVIGTPP